jgi:hypothetical protein
MINIMRASFDKRGMMRPVIFLFTFFSFVAIVGCSLTTTNQPAPTPQPITPQRSFGAQQAPTPVPTIPPATFNTPVFVTLTPVGTPLPPIDTDLPNPQPGEQTENIVEALINRVLIPAWNFLYTFVTGALVSLWDFAGLRGGLSAQIIFCLIPGIIVAMAALWRVFRRAR